MLVLQYQVNLSAVTLCKKDLIAYQSCTKKIIVQDHSVRKMDIFHFTPISKAELPIMTVTFVKRIMFQIFLRVWTVILSTS